MNKKKDILILCQYFYPEYVSSAILPTQLAEELASAGYSVGTICGWPKEYHTGEVVSKKEEYKGINIYRIKYGSFNNKTKIGRLINFFSFFISTLLRLPKIMKYKVVIVYSNPPVLPFVGYLAQKIGKVKLVFVGFDLYPDNAIAINAIKPDGAISKLMKYINKKVYSNANKIIAISEDMKTYMMTKYEHLKDNQVTIIPNWYTGEIDASKLVKNEDFKIIRDKWNLIILYTGNMGEAQDMDTIIDSIIQINNEKLKDNVFFIFTGHGSKQKQMEQKLIENGINNYKFYGFLKGQDYKDVLNIADICLVSLKKGIEGLGVPSKTYGYFAYSKPVISIMSEDTELAKNIIAYNAGFNVSQGDVLGFIKVIRELIENPQKLEILNINSNKIHEELYKKELSLNKYKDMISELTK